MSLWARWLKNHLPNAIAIIKKWCSLTKIQLKISLQIICTYCRMSQITSEGKERQKLMFLHLYKNRRQKWRILQVLLSILLKFIHQMNIKTYLKAKNSFTLNSLSKIIHSLQMKSYLKVPLKSQLKRIHWIQMSAYSIAWINIIPNKKGKVQALVRKKLCNILEINCLKNSRLVKTIFSAKFIAHKLTNRDI